MDFDNENTLIKLSQQGSVDDFHFQFDNAVKKAKNDIGKEYPNYIAGDERYSNETFHDFSPSDTRVIIGIFQKGTQQDVRDAISAAKESFKTWRIRSYHERAQIIRRASELMSQRKYQFAALISLEAGKNRFEAIADVDEGIDMMRYYAFQLEVNNGYEMAMKTSIPGENTRSVLKPYGVWGIIAPFNFPVALTVGMCTGVLVTGNTGVYKPPTDCPLTPLMFYQILVEAGVPPGAFSYVSGAGEIVGAEIVANKELSGIAFTGSKDVGVESYKKFNEAGPRPFIAEMGGKNPAIVTANADLNKAAEGVMKAAFGYGGQKCSACSRVYVDRRIKDTFLDKLVKKTIQITIGDPTKKDNYLGPLINKAAINRYQKSVDLAKKHGNLLIGGTILSDGEFASGYFVAPTIVNELRSEHILFKDELFVPILCVTEVNSLDEAITLANEVEYGLTAGIISEDKDEIQKFLDRIQAGVVYVNRSASATTGAIIGSQPFVGWKLSGSSGKGSGGEYYLPQFLREQSQTVAE